MILNPLIKSELSNLFDIKSFSKSSCHNILSFDSSIRISGADCLDSELLANFAMLNILNYYNNHNNYLEIPSLNQRRRRELKRLLSEIHNNTDLFWTKKKAVKHRYSFANDQNQITDIFEVFSNLSVCQRFKKPELIVLKDEDKKIIDYPTSREDKDSWIQRQHQSFIDLDLIQQLNQVLSESCIEMPKTSFIENLIHRCKKRKSARDKDKRKKVSTNIVRMLLLSQSSNTDDIIDIKRLFTYRRIFNNSSFFQGGRYYCPGTNLKSSSRQHITINRECCVELDYSALHPTMLALETGKPDKAHTIYEEFQDLIEERSRKKAKKLLNTLINADNPNDFFGQKKRGIGRYHSYSSFLCAVESSPLKWMEPFFFSGKGIELQFLDSQIAQEVVRSFISKNELPILIYHDSFLVRESEESALRQAMKEAFQEVLGTDYQPAITRK